MRGSFRAQSITPGFYVGIDARSASANRSAVGHGRRGSAVCARQAAAANRGRPPDGAPCARGGTVAFLQRRKSRTPIGPAGGDAPAGKALADMALASVEASALLYDPWQSPGRGAFAERAKVDRVMRHAWYRKACDASHLGYVGHCDASRAPGNPPPMVGKWLAVNVSADIISVLSCIGQRFAHIGIEARDAAPCASRYPGPGPIAYRVMRHAFGIGRHVMRHTSDYVVTVMRHKR